MVHSTSASNDSGSSAVSGNTQDFSSNGTNGASLALSSHSAETGFHCSSALRSTSSSTACASACACLDLSKGAGLSDGKVKSLLFGDGGDGGDGNHEG